MADQKALQRIGLGFCAVTVAVVLIAAAVVGQHVGPHPTADRGESLPDVAQAIKR
jgi:hypothetical protein